VIVKLNKQDMDKLTKLVTEQLMERMAALAVNDAAFRMMSKKAEALVLRHINKSNFASEAKRTFHCELVKNGSHMLRGIVNDALSEALQSDDLVSAVRKMICNTAIESAQNLAKRLQDEDW